MRRARAQLLFLFVTLATAAVPARSQVVRGRPGEGYALLIAVRQYEPSELRSLRYTEADVEGLAEVLAKAGYPRANIRVMSQTRGAERTRLLPTGANIRAELGLMLKNMDESDRVVVALAGHGVQLAGGEESYFCPADARLDDRSSLLPLTQVYAALEACGAGSKVLLVDACRNDPLTERARAAGRAVVDLPSLTRPLKRRTLGGVAALFSCSGGERAYEDPELKHGVFFHFVIKGLEGEADFDNDGVVDLDELSAYAKKRVYRFVEGEYRVEQTPELVGKGNLMELARLVRPALPAVSRTEPGARPARPAEEKADLASRTPTVAPPRPPPDEAGKSTANGEPIVPAVLSSVVVPGSAAERFLKERADQLAQSELNRTRNGIRVGDFVRVTVRSTDLMAGERVAAQATQDSKYRVLGAQGDWFLVETVDYGKFVLGQPFRFMKVWLKKSHVRFDAMITLLAPKGFNMSYEGDRFSEPNTPPAVAP